MGLADWFSSFCDNIKVKSADTISSRYKEITRRLNTDFWDTTSDTAHSLYVGSYGRNTATEGFSDLDVLMQLPYSVYERYNGYSVTERLNAATEERLKTGHAVGALSIA